MTCPTRLGVNVDTPPNGDATNRSWLDLLDTAVAMGIGLVRISWEIDWDPTPGASWPAILGAIHDRGLAVIDGVQGMPAAWSSTGQAGHYWPSWPTGVQAYAAHLAWRSSLLAAGDALEIGNEWNNPASLAPGLTPNPTYAAAMCTFAGTARRPGGPALISCGLSPMAAPNDPVSFARAMLADDLADHVDGLGVHPYAGTGVDPEAVPLPSWSAWNVLAPLSAMLTTARSGLGLYLTEFGERAMTAPSDEAAQAAHLDRYLDAIAHWAGAAPIVAACWYNMRDGQAGPSDDLGLLRADGSWRPSANVMASRSANFA